MTTRTAIIICMLSFAGVSLTPSVSAAGTMLSASAPQTDSGVAIRASLKLARRAIELNNYTRAQSEIDKVLKMQPNNAEALKLKSEIQEGLARQLRTEKAAFDAACREGTTDALRRFMKDFAGSPYCADAQGRLDDYDLWMTAKTKNTRQAYEDYLRRSKLKSYKTEADAAISNIEAHDLWQELKDTPSAVALEEYLEKYPASPYFTEARAKWAILKGRAAYAAGQKSMAKSYYQQAKTDGAVFSDDDNKRFSEITDYEEHIRMLNSSNQYELRSFLTRVTPSSPYYKPVASRLSRVLADKLSSSSTDYDYDEVLRYANDSNTKNYANARINRSKEDRKSYQKYLAAQRRKERWRDRVRLGWNILDFDVLSNTMSLSTGINLRLGRHTDVFNFTVGINYTYITMYDIETYDSDYYYDYSETNFETLGHYITFPMNIKFNTFRVGSSSKFYFGCTGEYGLLLSGAEDARESTLAIAPTVGFNFKHGDIGFYYKIYLNDYTPSYYDEVDTQRVGLLFTWYF